MTTTPNPEQGPEFDPANAKPLQPIEPIEPTDPHVARILAAYETALVRLRVERAQRAGEPFELISDIYTNGINNEIKSSSEITSIINESNFPDNDVAPLDVTVDGRHPSFGSAIDMPTTPRSGWLPRDFNFFTAAQLSGTEGEEWHLADDTDETTQPGGRIFGTSAHGPGIATDLSDVVPTEQREERTDNRTLPLTNPEIAVDFSEVDRPFTTGYFFPPYLPDGAPDGLTVEPWQYNYQRPDASRIGKEPKPFDKHITTSHMSEDKEYFDKDYQIIPLTKITSENSEKEARRILGDAVYLKFVGTRTDDEIIGMYERLKAERKSTSGTVDEYGSSGTGYYQWTPSQRQFLADLGVVTPEQQMDFFLADLTRKSFYPKGTDTKATSATEETLPETDPNNTEK